MSVKINLKAQLDLTKKPSRFRDHQDGETIALRFAPPIDQLIFVRTACHYKFSKDGRTISIPNLGEHGNDQTGTNDYIEKLSSVLQKYGANKHEKAVGKEIRLSYKYYAQAWEVTTRTDGKTVYSPFFYSVSTRGVEGICDVIPQQAALNEPSFADPEKGQTLLVTRTGKAFDTRFTAVRTGVLESLDDIIPDWKSQVKHSVHEILADLVPTVYTVEEQKSIARDSYPELDWERLETEFNL